MLENAVLLGADNSRTRAYIDLLARNGLTPARALILAPNGPTRAQAMEETELFDNLTPAHRAAARHGIEVTELASGDINDASVVHCLAAAPQDLVLFSGYGGAIVGQKMFDTGKSFLHMHPGKLPGFRGSTTVYHSLLEEDAIWVSAILMAPQIDAGPVVGERRFPPPDNRRLLDTIIDPYYRAVTLVDVLQRYARTGCFDGQSQEHDGRFPCFIIHPVLKHIAILTDTTRG